MARTALDTNVVVRTVPLCYARDTGEERMKAAARSRAAMKTGPLDVARPLVCVISWRLGASPLYGFCCLPGGLVLRRPGDLDPTWSAGGRAADCREAGV
jgi:hypothetical protein